MPIIAAVNGPAIGAGLDLACMCDMRIAAESARFAESFVKVGIVAGDGGAWLLPRVVGYLQGVRDGVHRRHADRGRGAGLRAGLPRRAGCGTAGRGRALAARIAVNPPHAVRMTKRLLMEGRNMRMDTLLEMSAAMQALVHATADHREAVDGVPGEAPAAIRWRVAAAIPASRVRHLAGRGTQRGPRARAARFANRATIGYEHRSHIILVLYRTGPVAHRSLVHRSPVVPVP